MVNRWQTHREYAARNLNFRSACEAVQTEPTTRQAAKWRRGEGAAWEHTQAERRAA